MALFNGSYQNNAYPPGYPYGYQQPQYQPQYPQMQGQYQQPQQQQQQPQQLQNMQQMTIQNGGFIPAPNEGYARNYPVAPGTSVTFKDESAPYIYTKTMSYNQMDTPRFERFRLVKEEEGEAVSVATNDKPEKEYVTVEQLEEVKQEIESIKKKIPEKKPMKMRMQKDEDYEDE